MILDESFGTFFEVNKDTDETDQEIPVFTFYPKKDEFLHWHIELPRDKAEELHRWLGDLLGK